MSKIIYPENEALRYVIAEQKARIEELEKELAYYRMRVTLPPGVTDKDILEGYDPEEERVKGM